MKLVAAHVLLVSLLLSQEQNFRIYPSAVTQTEVFVVNHPNEPNTLFVSANTINLATGFISEGIYVSTDAGVTWRGNDTCSGAPLQFHKGDPGIAIDINGNFILTRLGFSDGLYSHFSTDQGKSWSSQKTIALEKQDRAALVTDTTDGSPFKGRSYSAYVEFLPPFPVKVAFSDNGGSTWSTPAAINSPPNRSQGAELAVGVDGELYAVWSGVTNISPFTEDYIGFARSTNGGSSWSVTENAIDMNGIQGILSSKGNIRVNGLPKIAVDHSQSSTRGTIYLVTTQKELSPAGADPDIILYRSTDRGQSWSTGIRVNQDQLNNGKIQYFPAIHIDAMGGINILYYDDRNTTSDSVALFVSRSTDGGTTWSDVQISDHNFKPSAIGGLGSGYQGDNITLTSIGSTLLPFWMGNSSGLYQIWSARIPFSKLVNVPHIYPTEASFQLMQNYPNPFNPKTTIPFYVPSDYQMTRTKIQLYDILGRFTTTILDLELPPGYHEIPFDASQLSSGIYFYTMQSNLYRAVRKMHVLK